MRSVVDRNVVMRRNICTVQWKEMWTVGGMMLKGENGSIGRKKNLSQCQFVNSKSNMDYPRQLPLLFPISD